jgi:CheY-like chemotaxis protein
MLSGFDVARQIREKFPRDSDHPVHIYSYSSHLEEMILGKSEDFDGCLPKPFFPKTAPVPLPLCILLKKDSNGNSLKSSPQRKLIFLILAKFYNSNFLLFENC